MKNLHLKYNFNTSILMPFCYSIQDVFNVIRISKDFQINLHPMYYFWGRKLLLQTSNIPTNQTLKYIIDKISDNYNRIKEKGPYYRLFYSVFRSKLTAECLDRLYLMKFNQKEKDILVYIFTEMAEKQFKYDSRDLPIRIPIEDIFYVLSTGLRNIFFKDLSYEDVYELEIRNVRILDEDLGEYRYGTIIDRLPPRETALYTRPYLGCIKVFTGKQERSTTWQKWLAKTIKNNLLHDGYAVITKYPPEESKRLDAVFKKEGFMKMEDSVWKKPSVKTKLISKKINVFY